MMDKYGVLVLNPDQEITIRGDSFADQIGCLALHSEALKVVVNRLQLLNPSGENEAIADLQALVHAVGNGVALLLQENIRWAHAQGLVIQATGKGQNIQ